MPFSLLRLDQPNYKLHKNGLLTRGVTYFSTLNGFLVMFLINVAYSFSLFKLLCAYLRCMNYLNYILRSPQQDYIYHLDSLQWFFLVHIASHFWVSTSLLALSLDQLSASQLIPHCCRV